MSNAKLIGALAVAGGALALGGTLVASGESQDNADANRTATSQMSSQHSTGPAQDEFRNDDGERYRGDNYRGEDYRGERYHGEDYRGERYHGENYHGEDYRGDHYRGDRYRGNPWPEFCSTEDPSISQDRAQQIALEKVPGASVHEIDLDRCYGMEWQFELRKGNVEYDLDINADNGQITEFEQDEDD